MSFLVRSPVRWWGFVLTIVLGAVAGLAWGLGAYGVLSALGIEVTPVRGATFFFTSWRHIASLWPEVGIEELIFRAPLALPAAYGLKRLVAPMTIVLSGLFGLIHGLNFPHLAIQGGDGIILSLVFLRCGGLHREPYRGWACSTVAHGLMDSTLAIVAYLNGGTDP